MFLTKKKKIHRVYILNGQQGHESLNDLPLIPL